MSDARIEKFARLMVDYSIDVQPGDRVLIESTTEAAPLVRAAYRRVLERGGHPHILLSLPDQDEIFFQAAGDEQLDFTPAFHQLAADTFDARIRIYAEANTRALSRVDPGRAARRARALARVQQAVFRRAAAGELRWLSTQFPTHALAMEAEMGSGEYADFVYNACHVDEGTPDPVAYWRDFGRQQAHAIDWLKGRRQVTLRGPNVDLRLNIRDRIFLNSCGTHNLTDGEIFTGPVEDSVEGWVRFTYPAIYSGRSVEGVQLTFREGRVVEARAEKNEAFLQQMLNSDAGARYVGEFAIGTNFEINRFTRNILFDEKIGGTFHMALGNSYPETGGRNTSMIHWDLICDLREESEIRVDGDLFYRNGQLVYAAG